MPGNDRFTVLLLHCDGTNGSTTFPNVGNFGPSTGVATPAATAQGNAQVGTAGPKFGTGRLNIDNTANTGITLDGSAGFSFGLGDFTIDCWAALSLFGGVNTVYDGRSSGGFETTPAIFFDAAGRLNYYNGTATVITGTTAAAINTYYHVAAVRFGGATNIYLNGGQEGSTYLDANNYTIGTNRPYIGQNGNGPAGGNGIQGAMDEIRVSKGVARWTTAFTPPVVAYDEWEPGLARNDEQWIRPIKQIKGY